jgi:hypothetical protein
MASLPTDLLVIIFRLAAYSSPLSGANLALVSSWVHSATLSNFLHSIVIRSDAQASALAYTLRSWYASPEHEANVSLVKSIYADQSVSGHHLALIISLCKSSHSISISAIHLPVLNSIGIVASLYRGSKLNRHQQQQDDNRPAGTNNSSHSAAEVTDVLNRVIDTPGYWLDHITHVSIIDAMQYASIHYNDAGWLREIFPHLTHLAAPLHSRDIFLFRPCLRYPRMEKLVIVLPTKTVSEDDLQRLQKAAEEEEEGRIAWVVSPTQEERMCLWYTGNVWQASTKGTCSDSKRAVVVS